jgi:hypothetical protein
MLGVQFISVVAPFARQHCSSHQLKISVFLQQICAYAWSFDLPSNPFICLSSWLSPCIKLSLMAEFFLWNSDWVSLDLHLLCRCWFIISRSYLDFSHPKPRRVTAWASPSNVIYRYSPLLLNSLKVDQALASSCPWWQSSSRGTLIEIHWTCIFYVDVGLSSPNPILISLIRNLVELPLERALPMSFTGIVLSCSIHWKLMVLHHHTSLDCAMCIRMAP